MTAAFWQDIYRHAFLNGEAVFESPPCLLSRKPIVASVLSPETRRSGFWQGFATTLAEA
jgi:hypothetical protein